MRLLALALAGSTLLLACGKRNVDTRFGSDIPENATFTVRVESKNALDVVVYLVTAGRSERIGHVTAHTTSDFAVRLRRLGAGREFSLRADPVGALGASNNVRTETYLAREGQLLTWTLESDFRRSTVTVF